MNKFFINFNNLNYQFFPILLIMFLPVTLLLGSAIINISVVLLDIFFLINLIKDKKINYFSGSIFYALLILWFSLIANSLFSTNFENSIIRALGFFRFIILIFAIKYYISIKNFKYKEIIFKIWFIVFCIVSIDLLFEIIFGFNTLGYQSHIFGRLSGFLNQELKIGNFYFGFILLALSFSYYKFKNISFTYILLLIFLVISFLIGERSNFIKVFLISIPFLFFINKKSLFKNMIFVSTILLLIVTIIFSNNSYKERFYGMLIKPIINDLNTSSILRNSIYGAHYDAAFKIFKKNISFGVGLKNFRHESKKNEYKNNEFLFTEWRQATHPHQLHLELLSETGLFGYTIFIIFFIYFLTHSIKWQLQNKNAYQLSGILFLLASLLPLLPSGSFFTTYGATIFWINFSIIEAFNKQSNKQL